MIEPFSKYPVQNLHVIQDLAFGKILPKLCPQERNERILVAQLYQNLGSVFVRFWKAHEEDFQLGELVEQSFEVFGDLEFPRRLNLVHRVLNRFRRFLDLLDPENGLEFLELLDENFFRFLSDHLEIVRVSKDMGNITSSSLRK